jgi:hypothetical protein
MPFERRKKGAIWAKKGLFDLSMIPRATSLISLVFIGYFRIRDVNRVNPAG